jgi:hypothetical protein
MAELYIDRGRDSEDENLRIFNELFHEKDEIERAFGGPLGWEPLEGRRACRIADRLGLGGYRDEAQWPEIHERTIDSMIRLERALKPYIAQLTI